MKVIFPDGLSSIEKEVLEDDYFKTLEDVKNFIISFRSETLRDWCDLKIEFISCIDTKKLLSYFKEKIKSFTLELNLIVRDIPYDIQDKYSKDKDSLLKLYKANLQKSNSFITQNSIEIVHYIDEQINEVKKIQKDKKREYDKKRVLTQEQKDKKKEYDRKYYLKKKGIVSIV